jgi:hypothetical protein
VGVPWRQDCQWGELGARPKHKLHRPVPAVAAELALCGSRNVRAQSRALRVAWQKLNHWRVSASCATGRETARLRDKGDHLGHEKLSMRTHASILASAVMWSATFAQIGRRRHSGGIGILSSVYHTVWVARADFGGEGRAPSPRYGCDRSVRPFCVHRQPFRSEPAGSTSLLVLVSTPPP